MFANFNKAFNKGKTSNNIPQPIIDSMNTKLPDGFEYKQINQDACGIVVEGNKMTFSIDIDKENEFHATTEKELMQYLYRTQRKLEVKSDTLQINGHIFNLNEIVKYPFKDLKFQEGSGKIVIVPPPFPEPFELPLTYEEGHSINIKVQRQPYADLNKSLYKSIEMEAIELSYIIDEVKKNMKMDFKINLNKAKSVEEIIIISKLYKNFNEGKFILGTTKVDVDINKNEQDDNFLQLIDFWQKVDKISRVLGVLFEPKDKISREEVTTINALYNSFIEKCDYKQFIDTDQLTLSFKDEIDVEKINCKEEMEMQIVEYKEYSILNASVNLHCVTTFSNFIIKEVVEDKVEKCKYIVKVNTLNDKGVLKKIRFFDNGDDVNEYRECYIKDMNR